MNKLAVLEGLLFVVGEDGLTINQMMEILDVTLEDAKELISRLKEKYEADDSGIRISFLGDTFKLTTKKEHREYYQKLIYKNILKDTVIYNGKYSNKENDINKTQVTKKIGIPSILDIKFESNIKDYYLANKVNDFDLIYNNPVIYGDKKTLHQTRYTITLDKKEINNFTKENNVYIYKEGAK